MTGARNNLTPGDAVAAESDHRGRPARAGLSDHLFHRRSPIRQHRRILRIRQGDHAADRRVGLHHRDVQRIAAGVRRDQYAARGSCCFLFHTAIAALPRCSSRRPILARLDRELRVRPPDVPDRAPDGRALAVLHGRDPVSACRSRKIRTTGRCIGSACERPTACSTRSCRCCVAKVRWKTAIVVVLSDHGEAMTLPNDAIMKNGAFVEGLGAPLKVLDVGHGQSVLVTDAVQDIAGFQIVRREIDFHGGDRDLP